MSIPRLPLLTGLITLLLWAGVALRYQPQATSQTITRPALQEPTALPGRIIVKLRSTVGVASSNASAFQTRPSLSKRSTSFGITNSSKVFPAENTSRGPEFPDLSNIFELTFSENEDPMDVAASFSKDPDVEYAEPRYVRYLHFMPNDSLVALQDHLNLIEAHAAWDVEQGDSSVVIGIVDSGVDWGHPDLAANIWRNAGEIPDNGIDDDANGYIDDIRGWDIGDGDNNPSNTNIGDGASHGTLVAGIAGAVTNNSEGIAGIGFNCRIMPVKVIADAADDQRNLIFGFEGIKYAAENGADIINTSWGGPGRSAFEEDIVRFAQAMGSLIVASAGNLDNPVPNYPAAYPGVLAVGALDSDSQKATFSSFGTWVSLSAPGLSILTTQRNAGFAMASGTSFSCPMVSGVAALVKSQNPAWGPAQVGEQVRVTAADIDDFNPRFQNQLGKGLLNASGALTKASPSIHVEELIFDDSQGNGNGIPEAGETIDIILRVRNLLSSASSINFQIGTASTAINIIDDLAKIGTIPAGQVATNAGDPLTFRINSQVGRGSRFVFSMVIFSDDGQYEDQTQFVLIASPTFLDHSVGNVTLTLTSQGSFGFNDFPFNQQGSGFVFNGDGQNLLYEGAIITGINPRQVSDVARRNNGGVRSSDFQILGSNAIAFQRPGTLADEQSVTSFTDRLRPLTAAGVDVTQESFSFANSLDDDFVLLKYTIENRSVANTLDSLYFGLFLDWNIPENNFKTNLVGFDESLGLGYMYSLDFPAYCGVKVLNSLGVASYRALTRDDLLDESLEFSRARKYQFLSEGLVKTEIDTPGDLAHLISTGPYHMFPKSAVVAGFALVAGTGLEDLKNNAEAAQKKWNEIVGRNLPGNLPAIFTLMPNYPNPFNPTTTIAYELPEPTRVVIRIYNVLGQEVAILAEENFEAGRHSSTWNGLDHSGSPVSTGVYIAHLRTPSFARSIKMLLLR